MRSDLTLARSLVAEGIDRQAVVHPEKVAISSSVQSLTFSDLGRAVGHLATAVHDCCSPGPWLPIFVDRSVESIVAVLAAIRSGRAFAPIDSTLPAHRVREIFDMIGDPKWCLLPREDMEERLPFEVNAVSPETVVREIAPAALIDPDSKGTLIFTSGSSSKPKAVVRRWSALEGRMRLYADTKHESGCRIPLLLPLSFSAGINTIIRLALGDVVCLLDPTKTRPDEILQWLFEEEIDEIRLGAGPLGALLNLPLQPGKLSKAKTFLLQSPFDDSSLVPKIRKLCGEEVRIQNSFASSEAGVVSVFSIEPGSEPKPGKIPIGNVATSNRIRLETSELGLEMLIRDPVALGYEHDPELTAEKFFIDEDGVRWWRSGDIATIDEEGFIRIVGRADRMVKINGVRIEPETTEHALRSHDGIKDAAVVVHTTSRGTQRLVGHVCISDSSLTPSEVMEWMSERLPSHHVPAALMLHESLPYTARLKLDRNSLQEMPFVRWGLEQKIEQNGTAYWVSILLEEIIGLGPVGEYEDFWMAGLDSLGAVELCAAISAKGFGEIAPDALLRERTALQLSAFISMRRPISDSPIVVLNSSGSRLPLFAFPGGGGSLLNFSSLATALGPDQPLVVKEMRGMHSHGRPERTLEEAAGTMVAEIAERMNPDPLSIVIGYSAGTSLAFETCRQLLDRGYSAFLVLIDGVPRGNQDLNNRGLGLVRWLKSGDLGRRTLVGKIRFFVRPLRLLFRELDGWFLIRFPGKRRFLPKRYFAFGRAHSRAVKRYRKVKVEVPTLLIQVQGNDLAGRCAPLVGELRIEEVGGDHHSMMHPPHVHHIAELIQSVQWSAVS